MSLKIQRFPSVIFRFLSQGNFGLYLTFFPNVILDFPVSFFYYFSDLHLFYKGRLSSSECRESQTRSSRLEEERTFERQKGHVRVLKLKKCQQQQVNIIYNLF